MKLMSMRHEDEWQVLLLGQQYPVKVEDERAKRLKSAGSSQTSGIRRIPIESPHARIGGCDRGAGGSAN